MGAGRKVAKARTTNARKKNAKKPVKASNTAKGEAAATSMAATPAKAKGKAASKAVDTSDTDRAPLLGILPPELRDDIYKMLSPPTMAVLAILQEKKPVGSTDSSKWWQKPGHFFRMVGNTDEWRSVTALSHVSKATRADINYHWERMTKSFEVNVNLELHDHREWDPLSPPLHRYPILPSTNWSLELVRRLSIAVTYQFEISVRAGRMPTAWKVERVTCAFLREDNGSWELKEPEWEDVLSDDRFGLGQLHDTRVINLMTALRGELYGKVLHRCASALRHDSLQPDAVHTLQDSLILSRRPRWTKTDSALGSTTVALRCAVKARD